VGGLETGEVDVGMVSSGVFEEVADVVGAVRLSRTRMWKWSMRTMSLNRNMHSKLLKVGSYIVKRM
jgi:hypothetical protein